MGKRTDRDEGTRAGWPGLVPVFAVGLLLTLPMCGADADPSAAPNAGSSGDAGASAGSRSNGGATASDGAGGHSGTSAGTSGMNAVAGASDAAGAGGAADSSACPPLAICGGDPTGHWLAIGDGGAASQLAGACAEPTFEPLTGCSDLAYLPASAGAPGITEVTLPLPKQVSVTEADVTFTPDQGYSLELRTRGESGLHFSPGCLTAHGANPTCGELQGQLLQFFYTSPDLSELTCLAAADGGCDCSWQFELYLLERGSSRITGDVLSLTRTFPADDLSPTAFDFCAQADTLQLSAHPGSAFIGSDVIGLRTLRLRRSP